MIMQGREHGALFTMPTLNDVQEIESRELRVDGGEGLVEHDDAGVLQQKPREQHALHLPARQRADGAALETGQSDSSDGIADFLARILADAAEIPAFRQSPIDTMS